ncbi:MAG TPA: MarR family winged helix-turn-helix transcriptional regulator [Stellaceae bacterium]|jgi:MarR family transcriptional regulator for hemolysin|nr:MarR family winged helix-turn-helix transcriptional regulator [Stellaceae bacterium]
MAAEENANDKQSARTGLGKLLKTAHGHFNMALRDRLAMHDISFSQFQHLFALWRADGINQTEISGRIGITTASSTHVLNTLEQMELIRRERSDDDRRNVQVYLTPAGHALREALEGEAAIVNERAQRGLTLEEIMTLRALLARVIANFRPL